MAELTFEEIQQRLTDAWRKAVAHQEEHAFGLTDCTDDHMPDPYPCDECGCPGGHDDEAEEFENE